MLFKLSLTSFWSLYKWKSQNARPHLVVNVRALWIHYTNSTKKHANVVDFFHMVLTLMLDFVGHRKLTKTFQTIVYYRTIKTETNASVVGFVKTRTQMPFAKYILRIQRFAMDAQKNIITIHPHIVTAETAGLRIRMAVVQMRNTNPTATMSLPVKKSMARIGCFDVFSRDTILFVCTHVMHL